MREILFRGNANGKWVEGQLVYDTTTTPPTPIIICGEAEWVDGNEWKIPEWYYVDPSTVGQYTGLTDKNGHRIYEGDIISTDLNRPYLVVVFRGGCFEVECDDGDGIYYDTFFATYDEEQSQDKYGEVIGNIHDNPDLLK